MKRFILSVIIIVNFITCLQAVYAQFLWNPEGFAVRQGDHIDWDKCAATNNQGETCVVWTDCRNGFREVFAQKYSPGGLPLWQEGGVLVSSVIPWTGTAIDICAAEDGGFIIIWRSMMDNYFPYENFIYLQKLNQNGERLWGDEGILVASSDSEALLYPSIISDNQSGCILSWQRDYNILVVQHFTSAGEIAPGWPDEGIEISTTGEFYHSQKMCSDGEG